jgi:hypothetical protein
MEGRRGVGDEELQRVTQTGQLHSSMCFLNVSMVFSWIWVGVQQLTTVIGSAAEKGFPNDW